MVETVAILVSVAFVADVPNNLINFLFYQKQFRVFQ